VFQELRVESQPVEGVQARGAVRVKDLEFLHQVEKQVRLGTVGVVGERVDFAVLLADNETVRAGDQGAEEWVAKLELRKDPCGAVGRGRLGRSLDARRGPGDSLGEYGWKRGSFFRDVGRGFVSGENPAEQAHARAEGNYQGRLCRCRGHGFARTFAR